MQIGKQTKKEIRTNQDIAGTRESLDRSILNNGTVNPRNKRSVKAVNKKRESDQKDKGKKLEMQGQENVKVRKDRETNISKALNH